jgi:hypothetical protein
MDDYWRDQALDGDVAALWALARGRFVISTPMGEEFEDRFGSRSWQVLNNVIARPAERPVLPAGGEVLTLAYMGSINSYYVDVVRCLVDELDHLGGSVTVDAYCHERPLPPTSSWRYKDPVPLARVPTVLADYHAALLLSSFEDRHRSLAETSLASKLADYAAAARPILCVGPDYSANVLEVLRFDMGEVMTSRERGRIASRLSALTHEPARLEQWARAAWRYASTERDPERQRSLLWGTLAAPEEPSDS